MSDIQFVRGEFQAFEVMIETGLHVGAIKDNLDYGEIVFYDGQTLKRGSMDVPGDLVPNLKGAIKAGWLCLEGEDGTVYVPQPANIKIHAAESHGRDRGEGFNISTVADEERDLGSREDIRKAAAKRQRRPANDQAIASGQGTQVSEGAPTGALVEDDEVEGLADGSVGKVVGKFSSPAKSAPVSIDKAGSVIKQIEGKTAPSVQKKVRAKATGDVQTARVGDDLEDLLPDAASSGVAAPGIAGEGQSDEDVADWAKKKTAEEAQAAKGAAEAARAARLAEAGAAPTVKKLIKKTADVTITPGATPVSMADEGEVVGKVRPADEAGTEGDIVAPVADALPEEPEEDVPPAALVQAKIEAIQMFVPGFEWDMSLHWHKRVNLAVEKYGTNAPVLNSILSFETDAVKKHILKKLYG